MATPKDHDSHLEAMLERQLEASKQNTAELEDLLANVRRAKEVVATMAPIRDLPRPTQPESEPKEQQTERHYNAQHAALVRQYIEELPEETPANVIKVKDTGSFGSTASRVRIGRCTPTPTTS
jgi:hypothetical protein